MQLNSIVLSTLHGNYSIGCCPKDGIFYVNNWITKLELNRKYIYGQFWSKLFRYRTYILQQNRYDETSKTLHGLTAGEENCCPSNCPVFSQWFSEVFAVSCTSLYVLFKYQFVQPRCTPLLGKWDENWLPWEIIWISICTGCLYWWSIPDPNTLSPVVNIWYTILIWLYVHTDWNRIDCLPTLE